MGWKEVRVHLLAAGARATKGPIVGTQDGQGDAVQAVALEILRSRDLPPLEDVATALERSGFHMDERRGTVVCFSKGSTKASLSTADSHPGKVLEVELEFECTASSISDLPRWSALADSLADEFALSPMNYESLTSFDRAEDAIRSNQTWREFSERYGWSDQ